MGDLQIFATPETLIGFHPDAGASFYLSHLPGYLGKLPGLHHHAVINLCLVLRHHVGSAIV